MGTHDVLLMMTRSSVIMLILYCCGAVSLREEKGKKSFDAKPGRPSRSASATFAFITILSAKKSRFDFLFSVSKKAS